MSPRRTLLALSILCIAVPQTADRPIPNDRDFSAIMPVPTAAPLLRPAGPGSTALTDYPFSSTGHGVIRGRVVAADDRRPLANVSVRVNVLEAAGMRTATTDAEGRYEVRELPAGQFVVRAYAQNFLDTWFGAPVGSTLFTSVEIGANQTVDDVDLALAAPSAITGRITNERGEPVPNAAVTVMEAAYASGQPDLRPLSAGRWLAPTLGETTTGADGSYRVDRLPPGHYFVAVSRRSTIAGLPAGDNGIADGYPLVLYPGATRLNAARRIDLGVETTVARIDIALPTVPLVTVSGSVFGTNGEVVTTGTVRLMPRDVHVRPPIESSMRSASVSRHGTFTVRNVPPGSYSVRASVPSTRTITGPPTFPFAIVTVTDSPVAGVSLRQPSPVTIRGRVVFEQRTSVSRPAFSSLFVTPNPWTPDDGWLGVAGMVGGRRPSLGENGSFELRTVPGLITLRIGGLAMPEPEWQVKVIRVGGRDVTDAAIPLGAAGLSDIDITLTDAFPRISGRVTTEGSYRNTRVLLFTRDASRWTLPTDRHVAIAAPDNAGRFAVTTLPPGDYYAIAVSSGFIDWRSPERLAALATRATSVSCKDNSSPQLDLHVIE